MLLVASTQFAYLERMDLASRITATYQALGISQAEAARRCGMSPQRFGNYATGKRGPDLKTLVAIANGLNTTPDTLLGVNDTTDAELADILSRLLELEGLAPLRARTVAEAASATHRLLKALPPAGDSADRLRIATQAVWTTQQSQSLRK